MRIEEAINPINNKLMTINDWLIESTLKNQNGSYKDGKCPICEENMYVKAASTTNRVVHFSHYPNSECVLVKKNRQPYQELNGSNFSDENVELLKQEIKKNLYKIYHKCYELCMGNLIYDEFINMCTNFKNANVIRYVGIELKYIPYILVHLSGIIKEEFFFSLESGIKDYYDDLWIRADAKQNIWRIYCKSTDRKSVV